MQTLTRPITYREFRDMEFDEQELKEYIFELINGEIVARNYPTASHQRILRKLTVIVDQFVTVNQLGEVLFAPFGVVLNNFSDVQPDLMFVSTAKADIVQEEGIFGVPDLLVEIISPSSLKTDRHTKFKLYEQMGVGEYWIVDVKNQSIEVYQCQAEGFELVSFAVEKGEVASNCIAGLQIEISALFA